MSSGEEGAIHPIGVAAERSGLTADVIRAWERRYGVVEPRRDAAGRRVYTSADIARLRLLSRATEGGRSIGQVADLDAARLEELVAQDQAARRAAAPGPRVPKSAGEVVAEALKRVRGLDGAGLESLLVRSASLYGVPAFLRGVLAPLFREIGEEWHAGRLVPSQEHLATALARSVLGRLLARIPVPADAPVVLVATPAGERHEIGALLAAAEATVEGWRVVYLGADLPAVEIASAARVVGARLVALGAVYAPEPAELRREVEEVRAELPEAVTLLLGGPAMVLLAGELRGAEGVVIAESLDDLASRLH